MGYGVGLTGKIKIASADDIRFSANYGDGMGRYTSLGLVRDAVLLDGKLETVKSTALFAAYHHAWSAKSSSNLILSSVDIDNPTGANVKTHFKGSSSVQINYLFSPIPKVSYGIMYLAGETEKDNGDDGKISRVQFAATYKF